MRKNMACVPHEHYKGISFHVQINYSNHTIAAWSNLTEDISSRNTGVLCNFNQIHGPIISDHLSDVLPYQYPNSSTFSCFKEHLLRAIYAGTLVGFASSRASQKVEFDLSS